MLSCLFTRYERICLIDVDRGSRSSSATAVLPPPSSWIPLVDYLASIANRDGRVPATVYPNVGVSKAHALHISKTFFFSQLPSLHRECSRLLSS